MLLSPRLRSPDHIGPLKSRRGCKACKIRKIKCGEEKPSCRRCLASKYKCEYATSTNDSYAAAASTRSILNLPISTSPNTVWRERRAFAYYFERAAPFLGGGLDQDFWVCVVPRACRSEPAIWDAVNAISTLFEYPHMCLDFAFLSLRYERSAGINAKQSEALRWYSRSLSKVRSQIDRGSVDGQVALISCALFVCIETLQGHVEEALQLYNQGIKLILDLRAKASCLQATLLESTLVPLFMRLGSAALSISGTSICDLFSDIKNGDAYNFTSLGSARDALIPLSAQVQILERESGSNPFIGLEAQITPELIAKKCRLQDALRRWHCAYNDLTQMLPSTSPPAMNWNPSIHALLIMYHTTLSMIASNCLERSKSAYDAHLPSFRLVVEQAAIALDNSASTDGTQPAFTFELGVGLPLFWTAIECHDSTLRRRALELLRRSPPVQGFYKCATGLVLAGKIIEQEEALSRSILRQRAQNPTVSHDDTKGDEIEVTEIPEEARIHHYAVFRPRDQPFLLGPHDASKWNRGPEELFMRYTRYQRDPYDESVSRLIDECVPLD
ncbi:hypothetical protein ASPVEDRAFT_79849 [Aspergillus versicolor CBS 583.65]|uniref:Zn(2)-C6 fungal-type domain-containing protein n=1 Tax=Aspergillus versicolor CBS 583.65 TaxID=1036611 RepID=A0A1L9P9I7_ASPVE|nr:uncharacterized protein ASPVEDRAFT_79849 [Aspergillus versicolor CBS 583.65]OJI98187.1 hypothetical protein ASPVEDRAFT_79849 [Aspergillus versicolor CBS 583.65]